MYITLESLRSGQVPVYTHRKNINNFRKIVAFFLKYCIVKQSIQDTNFVFNPYENFDINENKILQNITPNMQNLNINNNIQPQIETEVTEENNEIKELEAKLKKLEEEKFQIKEIKTKQRTTIQKDRFEELTNLIKSLKRTIKMKKDEEFAKKVKQQNNKLKEQYRKNDDFKEKHKE